MLTGQMSSWQLAYIKEGPRNLPLNLVKIGSVSAEKFRLWTNVARTNNVWTNVAIAVEISSRLSQEPIFKIWSKSGQHQLRYSWYGQMSPGQILPGQMSPLQLKSVLDGPRNLSLKVGQNLVINSWNIADIKFVVVLLRVAGWVAVCAWLWAWAALVAVCI